MTGTTRTQKAARNFMFSSVGNIIGYIAAFILQTLFIHYLGLEYNGVKGLFSNVLGTLSLAELGISSAITFSLFEPLAKNDTRKIQAIINFYRKAYQVVALVVLSIGLCLVPFLRFMVHDSDGISHLTIIYLLYLADSVLSYLIIYKSTLLEADQKSYLYTRIYTIGNLVSLVVQAFVIIVYKNFILFLIAQIVIGLLSKIAVNFYTGKEYPYLKDGLKEELEPKERKTIMNKIKALLILKIGDVAINQTDNIIMSSMISLTAVGLCGNFTMIIRIITTMVTSFFVSAAPGLGNVVATEGLEVKHDIFKKYDFLGFVFYGWTAVFLYFLLTPFVTVWIGGDKLIDGLTLLLLCINYYFTGQRISLANMKTAAGIFEQGAWLSVIEAIINIFVSIIGVKLIGLPGIFLGTLISSMIQNFCQPYILYKYLFKKSCKEYFARYFARILVMLICLLLITGINHLIPFTNSWALLGIIFILCLIIPIALIWIFFHKTTEWNYFEETIKKFVNKITKKKAN